MVRKGKVSSVDEEKGVARVFFGDAGVMSGELRYVKHPCEIIDGKTSEESGGSGESSFSSHSHDVNLRHWVPKVNDFVLCIYEDGFNADGYILGGL